MCYILSRSSPVPLPLTKHRMSRTILSPNCFFFFFALHTFKKHSHLCPLLFQKPTADVSLFKKIIYVKTKQ